jgi:hypothetical protein
MKHKWHQEIKAWANGAEIEGQTNHPSYSKKWITYKDPAWNSAIKMKFRIKQPEDQKYLYVYKDEFGNYFLDMELRSREFVKKIRLEADDV